MKHLSRARGHWDGKGLRLYHWTYDFFGAMGILGWIALWVASLLPLLNLALLRAPAEATVIICMLLAAGIFLAGAIVGVVSMWTLWSQGPRYRVQPKRLGAGWRTLEPVEAVRLERDGGDLRLRVIGAQGSIEVLRTRPTVQGWTWHQIQGLAWDLSDALTVPLELRVDVDAESAAHHQRIQADLEAHLERSRRLLSYEHSVPARAPQCVTWDHHGATSPYARFDDHWLMLGTWRCLLVDVLQIEASFDDDGVGNRMGRLCFRTRAHWGGGPRHPIRHTADCADLHGLVELLREKIANPRPPPAMLGHADEIPEALDGLRQRARVKAGPASDR